MRLSRLPLRAALTGAALLALPAIAQANGQPVTGSLTWTMPTSASAGSWLGYVSAHGGTATPGAGATTAPGGFRFDLPRNLTGSGSNYDPDNFAGAVAFAGTVTFTLPTTGQTVAITDPRVDLSRAVPGGSLAATGQGISGAFTNDSAMLNLDTNHATWRNSGLSTQIISGVVPRLPSSPIGSPIFPTDFPAAGTTEPFGTMTFRYDLPLGGVVRAQKGTTMTIATSPLNRPRRASTAVKVASPTSSATVATGTLSRSGVLRLQLKPGTSTLAGNTWALTAGSATTPVYLELSCDTAGPGCALPGAGTN